MLLNQVVWAFKEKHYSSFKEFNKDVQEYQTSIIGDDELWQPDAIVADFPEIQVCYEAWIKNPRALLKNESLTVPLNEVFNDDVDEDEYQEVEILAKLSADNGKNFTASELLMKTHNTLVNKELGDHVFFEGFEIDDTSSQNEVPTFYVILGS